MCVRERLYHELVTLALIHQPRTALGALVQCSTQSQFIKHTVPTLGTLQVNILSKDATHRFSCATPRLEPGGLESSATTTRPMCATPQVLCTCDPIYQLTPLGCATRVVVAPPGPLRPRDCGSCGDGATLLQVTRDVLTLAAF
jgi:hypothetical protein